MDIVHTEEYKGKIIKIVHDDYPENPRGWENRAIMACTHSKYLLGDKSFRDSKMDIEGLIISLWLDHATESEFQSKILKDLPKYNTSKIDLSEIGDTWKDRFDYLYNSYDACINIMGNSDEDLELPLAITWSFLYLYDHSGITISMNPFSCRFDSGIVGIIYMIDDPKNPISLEEQYKIMRQETKTYDDYIRGNCYGFQILDSEDNELDSCYGFIGDWYEYCLSEAKHFIDSI